MVVDMSSNVQGSQIHSVPTPVPQDSSVWRSQTWENGELLAQALYIRKSPISFRYAQTSSPTSLKPLAYWDRNRIKGQSGL